MPYHKFHSTLLGTVLKGRLVEIGERLHFVLIFSVLRHQKLITKKRIPFKFNILHITNNAFTVVDSLFIFLLISTAILPYKLHNTIIITIKDINESITSLFYRVRSLRAVSTQLHILTWNFCFVHHSKCECVLFHYQHKLFTLGKLFSVLFAELKLLFSWFLDDKRHIVGWREIKCGNTLSNLREHRCAQ